MTQFQRLIIGGGGRVFAVSSLLASYRLLLLLGVEVEAEVEVDIQTEKKISALKDVGLLRM